MTGGALRLADDFNSRPPFAGEAPDLIVATDMLDLSTFLALTREKTAGIPAILYAHENQWTYPLPEDPETGPMRRQGGKPDRQLAWINIRSMFAADIVAFNSSFHREEFLSSLPAFFRHYPDETDPSWTQRIEAKSRVLPLGIDLGRLDDEVFAAPKVRSQDRVPLVLWNHRWEYDKDPQTFFAAVDHALSQGAEFRLAVCGANVRHEAPEFDAARARHEDRIAHWGYADADTYRRLLWESDVVVSTARHEFFGISVCEALYCRTMPVLPRSLAYPELIPETLRGRVLYDAVPNADEKILKAGRALAAAVGFVANERSEAQGHGARSQVAQRQGAQSHGLQEQDARRQDAGGNNTANEEPALEATLTQLRDAVSVHDWSVRAPEYDQRMREWLQTKG